MPLSFIYNLIVSTYMRKIDTSIKSKFLKGGRNMQKLEQKKSAVDLTELAIGIVVLGIVVAVGATILINVRDTNTAGTAAYNVSNAAATGLAEYGNWFKILVIVGIAAVVLSLIFMAFGRKAGGTTY